jgi:hypothetical protein
MNDIFSVSAWLPYLLVVVTTTILSAADTQLKDGSKVTMGPTRVFSGCPINI